MKPSLATGADVRAACRAGTLATPTPGLAPGFVQANLVVLPQDWMNDFLLFCEFNRKPCPILDVIAPGAVGPSRVASGADIRTDLPAYRVFEDGVCAEELTDIRHRWRGDLAGVLLGCSFTFESALLERGLPVRHIEQGRNVPMYRTNIECSPSARFSGPMVVSMRPMTPAQAEEASTICARMPQAHGAPIHVGDPAAIGIADLAAPHYGDAVDIRSGEVPVFWACGVTPQEVLMRAKPPFAITHKPGHMFVTDLRDTDLVADGD